MTKFEKTDEKIPENQTSKSLEMLAEYFRSLAEQLEFAAKQVGNRSVHVPSTTTFRRGIGFVQNWAGNLFQAISGMSLGLNPGHAKSAKEKLDQESTELAEELNDQIDRVRRKKTARDAAGKKSTRKKGTG